MSLCRLCDTLLASSEVARGICDNCEMSIATAIKKKIIRLSQATNQN